MSLRVGDWVEIRSKEEILLTLDRNGRLEELPFMPQMFQYCGHRFRVYKRAHKTCDTINFAGGRKLSGGIHLENLRCDGNAFGGCQAACLVFWKEAWLRPVASSDEAIAPRTNAANGKGCTESDVLAGTRAKSQPLSGGPRYSCQATELLDATTPLSWWDARQYVEDYASGNASKKRLLVGFIYAAVFSIYHYMGRLHLGRLSVIVSWLYDKVQHIYGGVSFPRYRGSIPAGQPVPTIKLDLQPGELIRVKSYEEILKTLDTDNKNRGLYFDAEMVPYCDHTFRVRSRVTAFVNEKTGLLNRLRGPAVILEKVWCNSRYSDCRMQCPRAVYPWWRESWLERVPGEAIAHMGHATAAQTETSAYAASDT
ncbi:hypothetical protein [Mesorhizobium sp. M7A.F.Ca.US.014.04.1.1]|uniref:hypothetical protein n=1 Tax=Mesorhizobium sp. M7A.F.Ca.US.014.04.1.1 TaxID=2496744 RepID=UPI001FDFB127|nr:hypothetical protein [Mesorhizobium sp. M7A.F.Ca.US.014.04.1.1]